MWKEVFGIYIFLTLIVKTLMSNFHLIFLPFVKFKLIYNLNESSKSLSFFSLSLPQRHPKLPVSLQDLQIKNLHSQSARRDQGSFRSLLHPPLPEGERASLHAEVFNIFADSPSFALFVLSLQGYLVSWDVQRKVWDHLFGKEMFKVYSWLYFCPSFNNKMFGLFFWKCGKHFWLKPDLLLRWLVCAQVDFADTSVVITEPYFNFSSIQESMNEILFEEYQFQSALRINGESNWAIGECRMRSVAMYLHMFMFHLHVTQELCNV